MIDGKTIALRNPEITKDGRVAVEIDHPDYGWFWYVCDTDDVMAYSHDIRQRTLAMLKKPA